MTRKIDTFWQLLHGENDSQFDIDWLIILHRLVFEFENTLDTRVRLILLRLGLRGSFILTSPIVAH